MAARPTKISDGKVYLPSELASLIILCFPEITSPCPASFSGLRLLRETPKSNYVSGYLLGLAMLCQNCQSIFNHERREGGITLEKGVHTVSFRGIQLSGRAGCPLCAQLFQKLDVKWPAVRFEGYPEYWLAKHQLEYRLAEKLGHTDRFTLSFRLLSETNLGNGTDFFDGGEIQFEVSSYQSIADYLTINGSYHEIAESSNSDETWNLAIEWMKRCVDDHPECRPNNRPQKWYPTRLLDVGLMPEALSTAATIKLHNPHLEDTTGHYITVSHRWGEVMPVKLTRQSVRQLETGLKVADLPKTFADAVYIAWSFGIRYLWIDSLCIFQDSEDEWRSESAKMGLVYKNTWLNIAAIDSPDCNGGCFFERDKALVQPIKVKLGVDQQDYFCIDKNLWLGGIDEALLAKRGWFVQERLLSSRQIHFGALQLYWECRRHAACESLPGGILPSMFASTGNAASQQMKRFAAALSHRGQGERSVNLFGVPYQTSLDYNQYGKVALAPELDIHTGWRHTVANYSKCALTFPRDKLIAISGVAKEMSKVVNDQYLAGLWRSQLPSILLWFTVPNGPPENFRIQIIPVSQEAMWIRKRPLRAPTFSWASTSTACAFFFPKTRKAMDSTAVDILEAHVEPLAGDIYGEISHGYMRVRCTLYPVTLHCNRETNPPTQKVQIGDYVFQHGVFLDESPDLVGTGKDLHCMPVFFRDWYGSQKAPTQVRALLLQPSGKGRGHFERFGLFADWGNRDLEVFRDPWEKESDLQYEEALGDGQYIITIV